MKFPAALTKCLNGAYITRKAWNTYRITGNMVFYVPDTLWEENFLNSRVIDTEYCVKETNLPLGTFCTKHKKLGIYNEKSGYPFDWCPHTSDILADDWEVVKDYTPPFYRWYKPTYDFYDNDRNYMIKNKDNNLIKCPRPKLTENLEKLIMETSREHQENHL